MAGSNRPLEGLNVLDLSRVLAGPWCTQIFGDLGADVIKIERPERGDDTRSWGPPYFGELSAYYICTNRNKRSRVIDIKSDEGQQQLRELAAQADIVVENFKPGSLERYGLDYDSLTQVNPQLIYCSITGFGSDGPYKDRPGYDAIIQAMSGLMSITGPDETQPCKAGVAITDILTGLYASTGILAAMVERHSSGKGQHIEVALLDTQVSCLANVASNFLVSGEVPKPLGTAHPNIVPYQSFNAKDGALVVAVGNDVQFEQLSQSMGQSWYENHNYKSNRDRVVHRAQLVAEMQSVFETQPREYWLEKFRHLSFPCGPINNLQQLKEDPQIQARQIFTTMDDGKTPAVRNPLRFSRTPVSQYSPPPMLGADNDANFRSSRQTSK